jgi:hypothetical protein
MERVTVTVASGRAPVRGLLWLVAVVAIAAPWLMVVDKLRNAEPPAATVRATSIVWANRVFTSHEQFARWIRSRGGSYAVWLRHHPRRVGTARPVAHKPAKTAPAPAASPHPAARPAPARRPGGDEPDLLRLVLLLLGAVSLSTGILVPELARRLRPMWPAASFEARLAAVGAGASLALAAVVAGGL